MSEPAPRDDDTPELLIADHGPVRLLTLNRPDRANALSPSLARDIAAAAVDAEQDDGVRALVLTGAGGRHFCAGADLKIKSGQDRSERPVRNAMRGLRRSVFEILLEMVKPTIVAFNGAAYGAGLELALCCDIRIADEHAIFCLPEAGRGLSAQYASVLLPNIVPRAVAAEMLFTAMKMDTTRALSVGLVNTVTPAGGALDRAMTLAQAIGRNAPISIRRMKETMSRAHNLPLPLALRLNEGNSPHGTEDSREGVRAFVEGRPPMFHGR